MTPINHEEAVVRAFILPSRQERYLTFVATPKKRVKFIAELAHFKALNPKFAFTIQPNQTNPASILVLQRSKGGGSTCWVISENEELDAKQMDLESALKETIGAQMGTFISCMPGKLAYFEDEVGRFLLER